MGKVLEAIGPSEKEFIAKQPVFFVATAASQGTVNLSPKAPGNSLIVLGPHQVAYADLTGSGNETAAHVVENGRMTILCCNLQAGPPKLLRLHGQAKVVLAPHVSPDVLAQFPASITSQCGFRCIYVLEVQRISTSCGYSMPVMTFGKYRSTLKDYFEKSVGSDGIEDYWIRKNSFSIDGLPGLSLLGDHAEDILPKPKDGYISGERMELSSDTNNSSKATREKQILKIQRQRLRSMSSSHHDGSNKRTLVVAVVTFVAGILVGTIFPELFHCSWGYHPTSSTASADL